MKRLLIVVAAVLGGILSAHAKLNVVATLPDLAAMARDIGGDKVIVTCLGKPSEDPHYIQPKPSYIVALNKADVLIDNGLDFEIGWLPALLDQTRNGRIRLGAPGRVVASAGVPVLDVPTAPVDRSQGDVHPDGNPHYLLDPERGKIVARNITAALKRVAPGDATAFDDGLAKLLARIDVAQSEAGKLLAPFRGAKIVTYHKSFPYFAERYGLNVVGTVEPKPGIPPSPSHLAALGERMKAEGVKVIVQEQWHETRTPALAAKKSGAKVVVLPTQTGGDPAATDYPATIKLLAEKVAAALK
ncbi:MAG: zinc ABC transporter substrate-binding protein [Verrucomicrobia bacterium]|nr:zinc ABC transporter substrate-binding protein [Verrucomicrobiota bacterium]